MFRLGISFKFLVIVVAMKILYLITKSEAGGAQTHVSQLSQYFSRQGHTVAVMSYPGGWLQEESKKNNIKFVENFYFSNSFNPMQAYRAVQSIKKYIADFKPDIVHCHSSGAGAFGRLAVRGKIPTVYTAHGWGFNIGVPFFQSAASVLAEKVLSKFTTQIICVSQFVKDLAMHYHIAPQKKLTIIYNGIEALEPGHNDTEKVKITFIGRLAEPKNPLLLLEAFNNLSQELKNKSEVLIIGDGPKNSQIVDFLKKNNLTMVQMMGQLPRQDVLNILGNSDIFTLVSRWEGLPLTILEAMSLGLPVVASNVGGIHEAVGPDNGFLVDNTAQEISNALAALIGSKQVRVRLGQASYRKWHQQFSLKKMLEETENMYKTVL